MFFDIIRFLNDQKIEYRSSGKNIGRGWVGIRKCPFCGDRKYHLGMHKKTANLSCFRCGTKVWILEYLMESYKCTRAQAREAIKGYVDWNQSGQDEHILSKPSRIKLPIGATQEFPKAHLQYLESRGFGLETIQRFSLSACLYYSTWKYRVIIPILYQEKMVAFTGRAIAGQDPRYLHSPSEESVIPVKSCLYNLDLATKHTIIVEGPTDVWKLGSGAVCTFGTKYTNRQLNLLRKNGCEKATLIFDPDKSGRKAASLLCNALDMCGIEADSFILRDKDPGDLSEDEAFNLREEIWGKST